MIFLNTEKRDGIENDEKAFMTIERTGKYVLEDIEKQENRQISKVGEIIL